jgi:hypothetical protein
VAEPDQPPTDAKARIVAARARSEALKRRVFDAYVAVVSRDHGRRTLTERLELIWLWLLPWLGYLALLAVAFDQAMPAVLTGWVLILVWQMFAVGAHDQRLAKAHRNPWNLAWLLAPALLFATQSWSDAGQALANALIETTIVDVSALLLVLVLVMVLQPGEGKEMAWPGIVILGAFTVCFLWAFVAGWRLINPEYGGWRQLPLASAFLIQCGRDWLWLRPLARGESSIGDVFANESGMGLILGQLALWLLLPVPFALLR